MIKVTCENCGKEFEIENKYYNRSKTKNFFCSKNCSCQSNNSALKIISRTNDDDFISIVKNSGGLREIASKLGYNSISSYITGEIKKRCENLGIVYPNDKKNKGEREIKELTKGELLSSKNAYQKYRAAVRRDADKTYKELDGSNVCCVCGYDKHIEIAHVKAVSDFPDSTLIKEINNIDNMIPLCPNHHWEFDNMKLDDKNINKIKSYIENRKIVGSSNGKMQGS